MIYFKILPLSVDRTADQYFLVVEPLILDFLPLRVIRSGALIGLFHCTKTRKRHYFTSIKYQYYK